MKTKPLLKILGVILLASLLGFSILVKKACAEFSFSATPYDGSFDLRFGKVDEFSPKDVEKEVSISVSTDIGKQYQVIQEVLDSFTNAEGEVLPLQALTVYTLRGSNSTGTLNLDSEIPVRGGRTLIYTSSSSGSADSFVLIYNLRYALVSRPGFYRGRLNFFLEPIDSSQSPVMVKLDVEMELAMPQEVKITTSTGSKTIELDSSKEQIFPCEVVISAQGQGPGQYRIVQVVEPLLSLEGDELRDGVHFSVKGGRDGVVAQPGEATLKEGETLLYTSSARGADDEIAITYNLAQGLKAGRYQGNVSYYIQGYGFAARGGLIDNLKFDLEVEPIFEMKIASETGGIIGFREVKEGEVQTAEVLIEITSNLAKPYQVSQNVLSLLTNTEGKAIPRQYFQFSTYGVSDRKTPQAQGTLKYPTKSPVEPGEAILFISNGAGDPDRFRIVYELSIPRDQRGGNYSTGINYALAQLGMR